MVFRTRPRTAATGAQAQGKSASPRSFGASALALARSAMRPRPLRVVLSAVLGAQAFLNPGGSWEGNPALPPATAEVVRLHPPEVPGADANQVFDDLAVRLRGFTRPGFAYHTGLGVTYDGVTYVKGVPYARPLSGPVKEFLQLSMDALVLQGERRSLILGAPRPVFQREWAKAPGITSEEKLAHIAWRPGSPLARSARRDALKNLQARIATYERFNRDFPGFGGVLPWYEFDFRGRRIVPTDDWRDRVAALDAGFWGWGMASASFLLQEAARGDPSLQPLAERYTVATERLARNLVPMFFNPQTGGIRTEVRLLRGSAVPPEQNAYEDISGGVELQANDDGQAMISFMEEFADWSHQREGRAALHRRPAASPLVPRGTRMVVPYNTLDVAAPHEGNARVLLPGDVPRVQALRAAQTWVMVDDAVRAGLPALVAAANVPRFQAENFPRPDGHVTYRNDVGSSRMSGRAVSPDHIAAIGGDFVLGSSGYFNTLALWLKAGLQQADASSVASFAARRGIPDGYNADTNEWANCLTWDNQFVLLLSLPGQFPEEVARSNARSAARGGVDVGVGLAPLVRRILQSRPGGYERFLAGVSQDYRLFEGMALDGDVSMPEPDTHGNPKR